MKENKLEEKEEEYQNFVNLYYAYFFHNNTLNNNLKNVNALISYQKICTKLDKETNGSSDVIQAQKLLKEYLASQIVKYKILHSDSKYDDVEKSMANELEFNLNIYKIFKILEDEKSEIGLKTINSLTSLLIGEFTGIHSFESLLNLLEYKFDVNEKNKIPFEIFLTYMTIIINFLTQSCKFVQIFEILDPNNKGEVKTAELVPTLNKIFRKINNETTISSRLIKNLTEVIDANQVYIKKVDFYGLLLKLIK